MKRILLNMILLPALTLLPALALMQPAYAACGGSPAAQQVGKGIDETTKASCNDSGVGNAAAAAVSILSFVVGIAAILAIIWAGFKYITSGGDSNKIANAKSTLIYALIGLAVAGLTQILVHFVISLAAHFGS